MAGAWAAMWAVTLLTRINYTPFCAQFWGEYERRHKACFYRGLHFLWRNKTRRPEINYIITCFQPCTSVPQECRVRWRCTRGGGEQKGVCSSGVSGQVWKQLWARVCLVSARRVGSEAEPCSEPGTQSLPRFLETTSQVAGERYPGKRLHILISGQRRKV